MLNSLSILFAVMTLANILCLAIFGSLRHANIPGLGRWAAANVVAIASMILFSLRDLHPLFMLSLAGGTLFCFSIVLIYEGCREFFRRPPVTTAPYVGLLAVVAGICYWNFFDQSANARIVVISTFLAAMYAGMGLFIWIYRNPHRPFYSYGFILGLVAVSAAISLARVIVFGIYLPHEENGLLLPTSLNVAFITTTMLAVPAMSIGMVMMAHDLITERMERWINQDELTGALNRRGFFAKMRAVVAQTDGATGVFSLAIVDLDHFKSINDQYGHAMGDLVLMRIGQFIDSLLDEADVFGRLGGEEFVIMFPGLHRQEATAKLQVLRDNLRDDFIRSADDALPVFTFSAGVDEYRPGEPLENLMKRADMALYAAKAQGRDRVVSAATLASESLPRLNVDILDDRSNQIRSADRAKT
jgi:diguanylate cyclase (GGDEF)-like protein